MIDYTQELSLDFTCTLSATVHRKVELSLIWAQVALCKLTTGADLTVVNSICSLGISKYKLNSFQFQCVNSNLKFSVAQNDYFCDVFSTRLKPLTNSS